MVGPDDELFDILEVKIAMEFQRGIRHPLDRRALRAAIGSAYVDMVRSTNDSRCHHPLALRFPSPPPFLGLISPGTVRLPPLPSSPHLGSFEIAFSSGVKECIEEDAKKTILAVNLSSRLLSRVRSLHSPH
ncbi:hypothetical protein HNY73_013845 [Argiope bruennichi]|uniref:Uncharacterized protein n=1 Tax=Argiope bruennichi TaxID=94029 RepID=A0A8T0EN73_ARGBR|nr:hypothetical protein HNY73_013845 [Argiope bruennichi]